MSETSPTEQGDVQTGSAQADLPAQDTQPSADEQQQDSVSSGTQDTDQNQSNQPSGDSSTDDQGSSSNVSDDDGLAKFAKSQGIEDVSQLTEREKKLLKTAHDNQKAFRTTKQEQSDELRSTVQDVQTVEDSEIEDLDPADARSAKMESEVAALRAEQKVNNFYLTNPEAKDFDKEMTQLVVEEAKTRGKDAARYLASDLTRLLTLAKARRGVGEDQAKADGAREERERLRQRQEASADTSQAQQNTSNSKKVTREEIAKMDDATYEEFRNSGGLQAAIDRGDLY